MHLHVHEPRGMGRFLRWALWANLLFVLVEFVAGYLAHSLALISDAVHNLSDLPSMGLSLIALYAQRRPADDRRTYGYLSEHHAHGETDEETGEWELHVALVVEPALVLGPLLLGRAGEIHGAGSAGGAVRDDDDFDVADFEGVGHGTGSLSGWRAVCGQL